MFSFDTPHTPPTTKEDDLCCLRLIRSRRVGPATFHRLIAEHGTLAASLDALPAMARAAGMTDYEPCPEAVAAAELRAGRKAGARLIRWDDPGYPALLRMIDDAPPVLWVRGDPRWLSANPVAVIGARNASSLGLRMARGMAAGLGEAGHVVVAGLARGIDTAAHNAALPTGTVAVMAGGIDILYPAENAVLAAQIAEQGALVSEQPPGVEPQARHFPLRNRIVSGLARATIVIEAAHRSGSLITAKCALDQGREVMAVPGHPMDARAAGCNALIRDGAALVRSSADVADLLAQAVDAPHHQAALDAPRPGKTPPALAPTTLRATASAVMARLTGHAPQGGPILTRPSRDAGGPVDLEQRILSRLTPSPTDEDLLITDLGITPAALTPALVSLEMQGRVTRLSGGRLALA